MTVPPISVSIDYEGETAAERRHREAALRISGHVGDSDSSGDDGGTRRKESKPLTEIPIVPKLTASDFEGFSVLPGLEPPAEASASSLGHLLSLTRPKSCLKPPIPSPRTSIASVDDGAACEHEF
jgi:hypothetical protein